MRHALARFVDHLRQVGLRVSAAELIDAAAASTHIDLSDRDALRDALRATLAKSRSEAARFDDAFARFFAAPRYRAPRRKRRGRKQRPGGTESTTGASGTLGAAGRTPDVPPGAERPPTVPPPDRPRPPVRDAARGLAAQRQQLLEALRPPPKQAGATSRASAKILTPPHRRERDVRARDTRTLSGSAGTPPVSRKPFRDRWTDAEAEALAAEVSRLLARLRLRRVRRRRQARTGRLWVQRSIRRNLGHDGIPFRLVRHVAARREPHLLLLVDVSHSMARAAAVFLALATHLRRGVRRMRVYVFVDRAVEATRALPDLTRLDGRVESLERVVSTLPEVNPLALSDYGRTLYQLWEGERRHLRKDTVLLILGDARNNRFDSAAWTLEAIRERVRHVVWLVPEPSGEWNRGDSAVGDYLPFVDAMCETADLDGLRFGLDRAIRPAR